MQNGDDAIAPAPKGRTMSLDSFLNPDVVIREESDPKRDRD
ncbi:MAG: hypothetical protein SVX43_03625 [Cyanobacteriota bacterium]|nr:hypothetical protein [Cyanobacteriota bacterium]